MPSNKSHGFCPAHGIGFNRSLDRVCPQCTLGRSAPPAQLDFDTEAQKPLDASGKLLDPFTLQPIA